MATSKFSDVDYPERFKNLSHRHLQRRDVGKTKPADTSEIQEKHELAYWPKLKRIETASTCHPQDEPGDESIPRTFPERLSGQILKRGKLRKDIANFRSAQNQKEKKRRDFKQKWPKKMKF